MDNNQINDIVNKVIAAYQIPNMTLQLAIEIAKKVILKARSINVKAVVAISDNAGHPILVNADDDSYIASYDIAVNKAYTVVALKMSTKELSKLAQPNNPLYGIQFTNQNRIVIFGGGEPLRNKSNQIIGGIGVSGGSETQDTELAKYGKEIFEKGL